MITLFALTFMLCGMNVISAQINWQGNWAMGCDFKGNDIGSAQVAGELCSNRCQQTSGCSHFTWTKFNGGTCWMKGGKVSKADAVTAPGDYVCGIIACTDCGDQTGELVKGALLWSDEFNSLSALQQNWEQEVGGHGWGNNELQYYTNNNENVAIANGMLTIQARKQWKENKEFTSARLKSRRTFRYGIFEMRAKLPSGRGTWPAFWLLAGPKPNWKWPDDGEIDVMEHVGYDPQVVHGTIHCAAYNHLIGTQVGKQKYVNNAFSEFHLYQLDWRPNSIRMFIDGQQYFSFSKQAGYDKWPFDNEFQILLNLAVGGNWGGVQGVDNSVFPANYVIDYVRQYAN